MVGSRSAHDLLVPRAGGGVVRPQGLPPAALRLAPRGLGGHQSRPGLRFADRAQGVVARERKARPSGNRTRPDAKPAAVNEPLTLFAARLC